jgi:hypothetical protein
MRKQLGLALGKYQTASKIEQLEVRLAFKPADYGYTVLAESLAGILLVGEDGSWQQLLELLRSDRGINLTLGSTGAIMDC